VAGGVWGFASSLWQRSLRGVQGAIDRCVFPFRGLAVLSLSIS
jgi:hypothetical protein